MQQLKELELIHFYRIKGLLERSPFDINKSSSLVR